MLISSHILDELSRLATHYGFIDGGRMVKEMSAGELEARCRKCMRLDVSDTRALARVLDRQKAEYRIVDDTHADLYTELPVTELVLALDKERCAVRSIKERDESLEFLYGSDRWCAPCGSCLVRTVPACSATGPSGCSRR